MQKLPIVIAMALLAACSLQTYQKMAAEGDAQKQALLAHVPKCSQARECEGMWAAARSWVTANCGMKIQTITDSFIQTYGSIGSSAACQVTKDPEAAGGYSFHLAVSCDGLCVPSPAEKVSDFQSTVRTAGDAFKAAN